MDRRYGGGWSSLGRHFCLSEAVIAWLDKIGHRVIRYSIGALRRSCPGCRVLSHQISSPHESQRVGLAFSGERDRSSRWSILSKHCAALGPV